MITYAQIEWHNDALCAQVDPELFEGGPNRKDWSEGKKVCAACPIAARCLDYALAAEPPQLTAKFGLFGGLSPVERAALSQVAA